MGDNKYFYKKKVARIFKIPTQQAIMKQFVVSTWLNIVTLHGVSSRGVWK
jgi:hypothetical protein